MRITAIPTTTTDAKVVPLYAAVKGALGMVPNLMQVLGNSPAALQGYLSLNGALGTGVLPAAVRERLALLVAEANSCDYCLAAHTLLGKHAGLDAAESQRARLGTSHDAFANATLVLGRAVVQARGKISDADIADGANHFDDVWGAGVIGAHLHANGAAGVHHGVEV